MHSGAPTSQSASADRGKTVREDSMTATIRKTLLICAALCWCGCLAAVVYAQGIGGALEGTVKDESGGVVEAVSVRIQNKDTGQVRTAATDKEGRYSARELPPGLYDITFTFSGYNIAKLEGVRLSVGQIARIGDVVLTVAAEKVVTEVKESEVAMVDYTTATLSSSFTNRQIRELPILTRDLNNLALFAPGVFSVRTFSFASTLVPFAANGSRGRDNNFIIDSVDNNEPLFGGAATQFTNTDIFAEYRILTNQFKAEYGRNSGSVVNIITERGGNLWRGTLFWYGQHDAFNASNQVERFAQLSGATRFYENQLGGTVGGPLKPERTWVFASYQWDRARADLSPLYPTVSTLPTPAGLTALNAFSSSPTVAHLLSIPTVQDVPNLTSPCGAAGSNLPTSNPCTIGSVLVNGTPVEFGTYLVPRAGLFDVRDHQASFRFDHRLGERDDFYARYLFDDLRTPRTVAGAPTEVGFFDSGLLPDWRPIFRQRTQSLGVFWTHAWPTALHELRGSFTRISSQTGSFNVTDDQRDLPSALILDGFALGTNFAGGGTPAGTASLLNAFPSAGQILTLGRDSRATTVNSNLFQLQDNVSISKGRHSIKFGANFVRTQSNIRQMPTDLGQYIYLSFEDYVNNDALFAFQRIGNWDGSSGDVLPMREFAQYYFIQDDIRISSRFTVNLGVRYEHSGQPLQRLSELNSRFSSVPDADSNNWAPRLGFAWSPDGKTIIRGGYGFFYNPTVFNIGLLAWQSSPISPFILFFPTNAFPAQPFNDSDVLPSFDLPFTAEDSIDVNLRSPYVQNYSLSVQRQIHRDLMVEAAFVASKGTSLFSRRDLNPATGWNRTCVQALLNPADFCRNDRLDPGRAAITQVTNGAFSTYHALQLSANKRMDPKTGTAISVAYTWSHMIDNASEIFGPGASRVSNTNVLALGGLDAFTSIDAITPFPQVYNNTTSGEKGNSAFDRRHRLAISYLWAIPGPDSGAGKAFLGNWQLNGFFTMQSGQPFSPLNAFGRCQDANGDAVLTNDRPDVGNPNAPESAVALLNNSLCFEPTNPLAIATPLVPGAGQYITAEGNPITPDQARFVQVPLGRDGNAGRNILRGPRTTNMDLALLKSVGIGERRNLQFRVEIYNLFNTRNPGSPLGNVFAVDAQPSPAVALAPVGPTNTPARVIGTIPENALNAVDPISGEGLFLSRRHMNTSSRRFQFGVKFLF
jgi:hypothetical protein